MSNNTEEQAAESMANQIKTAVDKAQEESVKVMDALVKEGGKLRDQTLKLAEEKVGEVRGKVEKVKAKATKLAEKKVGEVKERVDEVLGRVEEVKAKATDTLDNLEQLFEERVARALKQLGVPTRDDVQGIAKRLEEMNELIRTLADDQRVVDMTVAPDGKDNLKLISGIGPVLEGKLNGAGICRYQQIAALTDADIEQIESAVIHSSGRIRRDDWIGQARMLYLKKYGDPI